MFSDKFSFRTFGQRLSLSPSRQLYVVFSTIEMPGIFRRPDRASFKFQLMPYRQRNVGFVINFAGRERDGQAGYDFFNEDYAAPPAGVGFAANVEPQIYLFEVAMERDRDSKYTTLEEQKAHNRNQVP